MAQNLLIAQLSDAATLMVVGMVVVFIFLAVLIGVVNLLGWMCTPKQPAVAKHQSIDRAARDHSSGKFSVPPQHIAAISVAVKQHIEK